MANRTLLKKRIKLTVLTLAILSALAFSSLALAQSSALIGLGCWSALTAGGDVRVSTTARVFDSLGQTAVGSATSSSAIIRSGYVQIPVAAPSPTPVPTARPITGDNLVFLSSVWSFIQSARVCS